MKTSISPVRAILCLRDASRQLKNTWIKSILLILGPLCLVGSGFGQKIRPLSIGDTVPNITLNNILNYKSTTAKLSDFKDKLLILDFWATWCGSCLHSFPEIYKLQNKFKDSVQILLVNSLSTKDSYEKIEKFIAQRKAAYSFPTVTLDTILTQLFPHSYLPYYVWLYKGKILAITEEGSLTEEHIKQALSGNMLMQKKKNDYDFRYPLFENGNGGKPPTYLYQSFLTHFIPELRSTRSTQLNKDGLITGITFTNCPVYDLYSYAYPSFSGITPARLVLRLNDSTAFFTNNSSSAWKKQNLYNYQALFPPCSKEKAMTIMQNDLQNYFGYKITSTTQEMNCWVLKTVDAKEITNFPKGLKHETNLFENSGLPIFFNNSRLSSLIHELELIYRQPFMDETGIKLPVKLKLPADLHNVVVLKKSLATQGLLLINEMKKVRVIILSNK